jgi:hypothetical protein
MPQGSVDPARHVRPQAFASGALDRHEQPATFTEPKLIGDYRTFGDPA